MPFFAAAEHGSPLPGIPSLSVPAWATQLAATTGRSCFRCREKSEAGQRKAGSCGITALGLPLAPSQALPDGAEGQAVAAAVALPDHPQKSAQPLARWQQRAFWAIFGHFSPLSVHSTATAAPLNFSTVTLFCDPH